MPQLSSQTRLAVQRLAAYAGALIEGQAPHQQQLALDIKQLIGDLMVRHNQAVIIEAAKASKWIDVTKPPRKKRKAKTKAKAKTKTKTKK